MLVGEEFGWPDHATIRTLRLISVVSAAGVGICLGVSGVCLQALLRNPLASPYILGLSAGAGLGVAISQILMRNASGPGPWWSESLGAVLGGIGTLWIVYGLSRRRGVLDGVSLLLVGVMVSAIAAAGIMACQHFAPARDTDALVRWMMGRISQLTPWPPVLAVLGAGLTGLVLATAMSRTMDAGMLSEDEAVSVGAPIGRLRLHLFIIAGVLTAFSVFLAGPIGFVGLVAPHVGRMLVGPRHRLLLPASALLAAILLLVADTAVLLIPASGAPLPIGVLTSAIGGPFFIWLLRRSRGLTS